VDAFFVRLKHPDLAPALDDGLVSTFLTRVDLDPDTPGDLRLTLSLRGRTWAGTAVREDWRVTARDVQLQSLFLGPVPDLRVQTDHPLIRERQEPWAMLRGDGLPADPGDLAAELEAFRAALHPLAGGFQHLATPAGEAPGFFALGPLSRLIALEALLERHGVRVQRQPDGPPPEDVGALALLHLGHLPGSLLPLEALILARSFHAAPLP